MTGLLNSTAISAIARWNDPARRPLFKGDLIDADGCMCAQGDVLHHELGWSEERLRTAQQADADRAVADALGISRAHAVLLRNVNDDADGAPSTVLTNPASIIGGQAPTILAFWLHLDRMSGEDWGAAWAAAGDAAKDAAWTAVGDAAWTAAGDAAWTAVKDAAWTAVGDAAWTAAGATAEIMGATVMRERGQSFFFLPLFGFADPEAVMS